MKTSLEYRDIFRRLLVRSPTCSYHHLYLLNAYSLTDAADKMRNAAPRMDVRQEAAPPAPGVAVAPYEDANVPVSAQQYLDRFAVSIP